MWNNHMITILVDEQLEKKLRDKAISEQKSFAKTCREILKDYFNKQGE